MGWTLSARQLNLIGQHWQSLKVSPSEMSHPGGQTEIRENKTGFTPGLHPEAVVPLAADAWAITGKARRGCTAVSGSPLRRSSGWPGSQTAGAEKLLLRKGSLCGPRFVGKLTQLLARRAEDRAQEPWLHLPRGAQGRAEGRFRLSPIPSAATLVEGPQRSLQPWGAECTHLNALHTG